MVKKPGPYGPIQVLGAAGLTEWQFMVAQDRGLIRPGTAPWTQDEVADILTRHAEIISVTGTQRPVGATKAARHLAERTGLHVDPLDLEDLVDGGHLEVFEVMKGKWALYAHADLDLITPEVLEPIVAARIAWRSSSENAWNAARRLGWTTFELENAANRRGIQIGRWKRYALADLTTEEAADEVTSDRRLGTERAAEYLDIQLRDFRHCVAAGWIAPVGWIPVEIGRGRDVDAPLYRVGDLDRLRERRDIPWEEVRAVPPGRRSRLLDVIALESTGRTRGGA